MMYCMLLTFVFVLTADIADSQEYLNVTAIRLVGGGGPYVGQVEIQVNDTWGRICDISDFQVGEVICRMLNQRATGYQILVNGSHGTGPIHSAGFWCSSNATDLSECVSYPVSYCRNNSDFSLICTVCGQVNTKDYSNIYVNIYNLTFDGTHLSFRCRESNSQATFQCHNNGTWEIIERCQQELITDIRVVGPLPNRGRVEVRIGGTWGTVCDDSFGSEEAKVICESLGFSGNNAVALGNAFYGQGSGLILVDELSCSTSHHDINECFYITNQDCVHHEDVSVVCAEPIVNITDIRFVNGSSPLEGRVEINVNGSWGTICDQNLNISHADIICRKTGYRAVNILPDAYYGAGSGNIFISKCDNFDTDLDSCLIQTNSCSHNEDVSVSCQGYPLRIRDIKLESASNGIVYVRVNNTWGTICDFNFDMSDASVICNMLGMNASDFRSGNYGETGLIYLSNIGCNGSEDNLNNCTYDLMNNCTHYQDVQVSCKFWITNIRLEGSLIPSRGRVAVEVGRTWGHVCGRYFDSEDARVVCEMLGFRGLSTANYFGIGTKQHVLTSLTCEAYDHDLNDCILSNFSDYYCYSRYYRSDAAVVCQGYSINITDARLTNMTRSTTGRAEVKVNGSWGRLCYDNFNSVAANLFCEKSGHRMFLHFQAGEAIQIGGQVYQTECLDFDSDLGNCSVESNNSSCGTDVIIVCSTDVNITEIRLVNGSGPLEGRAEIKVNGSWATLCGSNFGIYEADLFCRAGGLRASAVMPYGRFGVGNGSVYETFCNYTEVTALTSCIEESYTCMHDMDAAVVCFGYPLPIREIRLVGSQPTYGRIEILVGDAWSSICSLNFDKNDANVLCNMLGMTASSFSLGNYGGTGEIFMSNIRCNGSEDHINNCTYDVVNTCTHDQEVFLSCRQTITDIRLVGPHASRGRVEVKVGGTWGTVCDDGFGSKEGKVICETLGFSGNNAISLSNAHYGQGSGPILVDDLHCSTSDHDINDCSYTPYHNCQHSEDASVVCLISVVNITDLRFVNGPSAFEGRVEINVNGTWGTVCDQNLDITQADYLCRRKGFRAVNILPDAWYGAGTGVIFKSFCESFDANIENCLIETSDCSHYDDVSVSCQGYPLQIREIRLYGRTYGRVDVRVNDTWGTICTDNFDMTDANVICKMLGMKALDFRSGNYGEEGLIYLSNIQCNGSEDHLSNCSYDVINNCTHSQDVYVTCQPVISNIRLEGSLIPSRGRVTIEVEKLWGPICGYYFDTQDARIVCEMLGLRLLSKLTANYFGIGTRQHLLTSMYCTTTDHDLNDCTLSNSSEYNCYNSYYRSDAAVACQGYYFNITDARLINMTGSTSGRAEIEVDGSWGRICSANFNSEAANLLCGKLGYRKGLHFRTGDSIQNGSGKVYKTDCLDFDTDLNNCTVESYNSSCGGDLIIVCSTYLNISEIRLVNGSGPLEGRAEIKVNGEWATLCGSNFGIAEADLFCRAGGFRASRVLPAGYFGKGIGDVYQTFCNYTENSDLRTCVADTDSCINSKDAAVACIGYPLAIRGIRLVNGPQSGRVEILVHNNWSSICAENFDHNDSKVLCGMLGMTAVSFSSGNFGGSGLIYVSNIRCNGSDDHINNCTYDVLNSCTHSQDVYLSCQPKVLGVRLQGSLVPTRGRVEVNINGTWGPVCGGYFHQEDARVVCEMLGLSGNTVLANNLFGQGNGTHLITDVSCTSADHNLDDCSLSNNAFYYCYSSYYRTDAAVFCNETSWNVTAVRLANSHAATTGRADVLVNGSWGLVCSENFNMISADLFCRKLGSRGLQFRDGDFIINGSGNIYQTDCMYFDNDLSSCIVETNDSACRNGRNVVITCSETSPVTDIRLVNGSSPSSGRVEIEINGTWGTICGLNLTTEEADLFCRSEGSRVSAVLPGGFYGNGTGKVYQTFCNGTEDFQMGSCFAESDSCPHSSDAAVFCSGYPLPIRNVSLIGSETSGFVRILVNETWGTICANNIASNASKVICSMLGFRYSSYWKRFSGLSGLVYLSNLTCKGTETHINNCTYDVINNCTHDADLYVYCEKIPEPITGIRLRGSESPYRGRVEVLVGGVWGTVCDDYFDSEDARVICEMLGFSGSGAQALSNAYFGQGSGPILVDDLGCSSSDVSLNDCYYTEQHNCGHNEDASVICRGRRNNVTAIRFSNGTFSRVGRVEVNVNGTWGTVCNQNFELHTADLLCSEIGLSVGTILTGDYLGKSSGTIYNTFCESMDTYIGDCIEATTNCTHDQDVGIICSECRFLREWFDPGSYRINGDGLLVVDCTYYKDQVGQVKMKCNNETFNWEFEGECETYSYPLNITDLRLVAGITPGSGRIEIKSLNTWGTVCDKGFTMNEANVFCRMLGYPPAKAFYRQALYGPGSGPIFVDELRCSPNASHINDCIYSTTDSCEHSDDVSLVCTDCGDPTPVHGTTNASYTNVSSVHMITCDRGYSIIGNSVIICQLNGTWTNRPWCSRTDCGDPTPANGYRNSTNTLVYAVVMIACTSGYQLEGAPIVICQETGNWTSLPTCKIIDCGQFTVSHGVVNYDRNSTTVGSQAVISCNTGYTAVGRSIVTCLTNGTWEAAASCNINDCGDPVPVGGTRNSTDTTYGAVVLLSCNHNSTERIVICQADGSWSDSLICDSTDCGKLQLPNGKVDTANGTDVGAAVTASCHPGYDLNGPSKLVCTVNGWNDSVSCQKQDCGDPTPLNGQLSSWSGTLFGDTARVECNIGYELKGEAVIICEDGGVWSNNSYCKIKECKALQSPPNGSMDDRNGIQYNAIVSFRCNPGFLLIGYQGIHCESSGEWSADPPKCVAKSEIGGPCQGQQFCLSQGALCINNICTCRTGIHDARTRTCDSMPLLPYGPAEKDATLPKTSVCGPSITFSPGIPLFSRKHTGLHVCGNGIVSFDRTYDNPTPPRGRQSVRETFNRQTIVAPFHADIDIRNSGPVYYRTYDILNSYERMQQNIGLIRYIERIVEKFQGVTDFETAFVLIATWTDTICARSDFTRSGTSTFQVVIVTDGKTTYVFNIYGLGLMQWERITVIVNSTDVVLPNTAPPVFVGFVVDLVEAFTHPLAFSTLSIKLDIRINVDTVSDRDVAGLIFKAMTRPEYTHENHAVDCIKWYNENKDEQQSIDVISRLLPECPCDIWLSRFDPWFWKIGLERWNYYYWQKQYACVDMIPTNSFGRYGKSCCYNLRTWTWVYERPLAGGFQRSHPDLYPADHFRNDALPKTKCCVLSNHCDLYYKLRPTGRCYTRSPYNFGRFWGDPHFRTLDGLNFTFNGLGEFTMLRIRMENMAFDLQARTGRALKNDGNFSDATIFTAFAAKDSSNATIHVELNKAKSGLNIFANMVDLTAEYYSVDDMFEYRSPSNNLYLVKRDGALTVLFPLSGISLNISVGVEMLSLNTIVPETLANMTGQLSGLLGNYDGDTMNDFTMPNGTLLPTNITERAIFDYGMTWSIEAGNSAFMYEDGKGHQDYHNASYRPRFLDEADRAKIEEAKAVCNGSQSTECIFDYVFTEKTEVAVATSNLKLQNDDDQKQLATTVPTLTGCSQLTARTGQIVSCPLQYDRNDEIEIVHNSTKVHFHSENSSITYYQNTDDPVDIQILVKNHDGRSSPIFQVKIVLCTGCNDHGRCLPEKREDNKSTEFFNYYVCECEPQYDGVDCEHVFDGCASKPCSHGRACTSLSAENQIRFNRSYTCGDCPTGYREENISCTDIDECATLHPCQHICTNTEGSFGCACRSGYRADTSNTSKCKDVNECEEALHNCSQVCNNTAGSFQCSCHSGYSFNVTSWTCIAKTSNCNGRCNNTDGCMIGDNNEPKCFCNEGYELYDAGTICRDVNECDRNVCPQDCRNSNGSFECVCYTGYKLVGKTTCQECDVPYYGDDCKNTCMCTGQGADRCDHIKGCLCEPGWQGDTCDDDIDECQSVQDLCSDVRKECINSMGSFTCNCRQGYTQLEDGSCRDLDECSVAVLNDCTQTCTNSEGGYTCGCYGGYTKLNATHCQDINECTTGTHRCQQKCENNQGTYTCSCYFGYTLNDDRHTCEKQRDPCLTELQLNCEHYCFFQEGMANCNCSAGYNLASDRQHCTDINECLESQHQCDVSASCINVAGSYRCSCSIGYKLENNGRTCSECDSFHYGINCSQTCSCLNGFCNRTTGCVCNSGWTGKKCDEDINECNLGIQRCSETNSVCVNTLGSAFCACLPGYANVSGSCKDIDECNSTRSNACDQICVNTAGSYRCECRIGFQKVNGTCSDIDECLGSHNCSHVCENTVGGYRCSCFDGYRLNLTDRRSCLPEYECSSTEKTQCGDNASCYRTSKGPVCTCIKGFENVTNSCRDINECDHTPNPCAQNCNNTAGNFLCSCMDGYYLREDKTSCQDCESWMYGKECKSHCTCNRTNSNACDKVSGSCTCRDGWHGSSCSDDKDECLNSNVCPEFSSCLNTPGSFDCQCDLGYVKTGSMCEECDAEHFGSSCRQTCTCNIQNTYDCNHVNGTCTCKEGWSGITCTKDIDECNQFSDICRNKKNSVCNNTAGSFRCSCNDGYFETGDACLECNNWTYGMACGVECVCNTSNTVHCDNVNGSCYCTEGWTGSDCANNRNECNNASACPDDSVCVDTYGSFDCVCNDGFRKTASGLCIDVDECQERKHNCSQLCSNTNGGFTCGCHDGFFLIRDAITCVGCDAWQYGPNCSQDCGCNQSNTVSCNATNGSCDCREGWEGMTCSDDTDECTRSYACPENSNCLNLPGTYTCLCQVGFFKTDGVNCTECSAWTFGQNCSSQCICNVNNTYQCNTSNGSCICLQGWSGDTCNTDIDECNETNSCQEHSTCQNTPGSFNCICNDGYKDNGSGTCAVCDQWQYGVECAFTCSCNATNSKSCDHVSGDCTCNKGWQGRNCTQDVDECSNTSVCQHIAESTCVNSDGSYDCQCNSGFHKEGQTCTICARWKYGLNCELDCACNLNNTDSCDPTSGECSCKTGWQGDNCTSDIDECRGHGLCPGNATCNNAVGSFSCLCNTGFMKNAKQQCEVCALGLYGNNCALNCTCLSTNTESCNHVTGACKCKTGWKGTTCSEDVNECTDNITICQQKQNSTCHNGLGSYTCACNTGFKDVDNVCTVCDKLHYGDNCGMPCSCNVNNTQSCNHVSGACVCKNGWKDANCTTDVNECTVPENLCQNKTHSHCLNTVGAYQCTCDVGYKDVANICQVCDSQHFGDDCRRLCTCDVNNTALCNHVTGNCTCKKGWTGTNCSQDVNECNEATNVCANKTNSSCVNSPGSFSCDCNAGYYNDNNVCTECDSNHYGNNCSSLCRCITENTETCDKVGGHCTCKQSWQGETCSVDVDECIAKPDICKDKAKSKCLNTAGAYICNCDSGYKDINGVCSGCKNNTYGAGCDNHCHCNAVHARDPYQTCDTVSGTCLCTTSWKGETCNDDVDECLDQPNICAVKVHSTCQNTNGSYLCSCDPGYKDVYGLCKECTTNTYGSNCTKVCTCNTRNALFSSQTCDTVSGKCLCSSSWKGATCNDDVNECTEQHEVCQDKAHASCYNTVGSYLCSCNSGYTEVNGVCTICTGNTFGTRCNNQCVCNATNAKNPLQTCDTVSGKCNCNSAWKGDSCDEDVDECAVANTCQSNNNEVCVNTAGSYACHCRKGYDKVNNMCLQVTTTTTLAPNTATVANLNVKIEYDLPQGTNLESSVVYEEIKVKVKISLILFYQRFIQAAFDIIIINIRSGSVEVEYVVTYTPFSSDTPSQIAAAQTALGNGTNLLFDNKNVTARTDAYQGLGPCDIYEAINGPCAEESSCVVLHGEPFCRAESDTENWSAIGGAIAGAIFAVLVAVIAVVVCLLWRKRNGKHRLEQYQENVRYAGDGSNRKQMPDTPESRAAVSRYPVWNTQTYEHTNRQDILRRNPLDPRDDMYM